MALKNLLKHAPIPYEPALAEDMVEQLTPTAGAAQDLVAGIAGCSPFLRGLLTRESDWFAGVLESDPVQAFDDILANVPDSEPEAVAIALRQAKRRVALLLATFDLGGVWSLETITEKLTGFADFATHRALKSQVKRELFRGKLPGVSEADVHDCAGIAVLAMGKMGARELNYSSDIDLIVLFDESRFSADDYYDIRAAFLRITRNMSKMLSDITADGYVFRTDLRLRPNPSVTPVCVPMEAAERYYESEGRTWERAAYIKARPCAGDLKAGQAFLDRISPFVWRRHLDFAAIQDAHDMRLRIREHKGLGGRIEAYGHDMKLGRGGIREIEFFAQTQQLIAGGREKNLRQRRTDDALRALAENGRVPSDIAEELIKAYRHHRDTEHRIQMVRDAQTHLMPDNPAEMDRLARLSGWPDTTAFEKDVVGRLKRVHEITESFFAPLDGDRTDDGPEDLPAEMIETMDSWAALPAMRSARSVEIFERLRPELARRINGVSRPLEALRELDGFVRGLPAGVQLFSLFEANPQILDLLVDICATTPNLATYLSRNTGVFDAVLSGRFFEPLPDAGTLAGQLHHELSDLSDYEDRLNTVRRWFKEQHFRIGVLLLRNLASVEEAERSYSDLAEAVIQCLLPAVIADFARRYGEFEKQQVAILAMGKLGSRQMTATSDLDLIVIYQADGEGSDGKKSLARTPYFSRLTQAFITALSSQMAEGQLYEVDMRLRPSGRAGTVATSLAGFRTYQTEQTWTWEHLALTRARVVAGDLELAKGIADVRAEVINMARDKAGAVADVRDLRRRLTNAKGGKAGDWDVKERDGGLLSIELLAQLFTLLGQSVSDRPEDQLSDAVGNHLISGPDAEELAGTHRMLSAFQQAHRLLVNRAFDPDSLGQDAVNFALRLTGFDTVDALRAAILARTETAEAIIVRNLQE